MKFFFNFLATIVAMARLFAPPQKSIVEIESAETAGAAPPTDASWRRYALKVCIALIVFSVLFLAVVIMVASPPLLGAASLAVALVLAAVLLRHYEHQVHDNFVDKMIALALAWRRSGAVSSAFA